MSLERLEALEADVDARLVELWALLWGEAGNVLAPVLEHERAREAFASCLRTAYSTGYRDAHTEAREGRAGELHRRHGYRQP